MSRNEYIRLALRDNIDSICIYNMLKKIKCNMFSKVLFCLLFHGYTVNTLSKLYEVSKRGIRRRLKDVTTKLAKEAKRE